MKKWCIAIVVLFISLSSITISCKKYEEGPAFSLRSPFRRLLGTYDVITFQIDGNDSTQILNGKSQTIFSFDYFKRYYGLNKYLFGAGCDSFNVAHGNFAFTENDEVLMLHITSSNNITKPLYDEVDSYWKIIRLTNRDVWLETDYEGKKYYLELKHKDK